jgi:site-specific DNA-methyltransferase (adenine-specific)
MTPYHEEPGITIYCADSFRLLGGFANLEAVGLGHVDHVICDPPYTQRVSDVTRTAGTRRDGSPQRVPIEFDGIDGREGALAAMLLQLCRRWCLVFCAFEQLARYQNAASESYVRAGVWRKPDTTPQFSGDRPAVCGEAIAIMHGPEKKRWNRGGHPAYWECLTERDRPHDHPTPKPLKLMKRLIADFTDKGELILDPFCGSGTTLVAAKEMGRRAVGIEIEEKWCAVAKRRLSQEVLAL